VVVAVVVVLVVQVRRDKIVGMAGMRNNFVAAVGAVAMLRPVSCACVCATRRRLLIRAGQGMLIDVIAVRTVQVAIV